jgi:hypothetical protein
MKCSVQLYQMGIQQMVEQLVKEMTAKLYADRGYISQELKNRLKLQAEDIISGQRYTPEFKDEAV